MKNYIVISGGTSGIGLEIVKKLSENENSVIFSISRNESRINEAKTMHKDNSNIHFFKGDVSSQADCNLFYDYIKSYTNEVTSLINGAGIIKSGNIESLSLEDWNTVMNVNVNGIFLLSKTMLPLLKNIKNASVVNISSISSSLPSSTSTTYSVSKAAVDMLSKCMAKEFATFGIRVNTINPGVVETNLQINNGIFSEEQYRNFISAQNISYPFGIGQPNDIVGIVKFLISEEAKWITGAQITIDGGKSL